MRVADYIFKFLSKKKVSHVFTVSGGGAIFLCDAVGSSKTMRYVACHHEQSASMAAEAYARARNKLGVALVTSGPGGTNTVTGVAGAWLDHIPHLTISGQTFLNQTIQTSPGIRTLGVQEINIVDIVKPITKYAVMIDKAADIKFHLEKAFFLATSGRPGPVWLDIPADVQKAEIDESKLKSFKITNNSLSRNIEKSLINKIKKTVGLLKEAKRPLIHVGQGVKIANAEEAFLKLINKFNIPFVTARNANDIVESDHKLLVGRPGTFAQRGANFAVQTCDCYLAIGTRLSLSQTGYNSHDYARNAKLIMVDIDEAELNKKTLDVDIKIKLDAKVFIKMLNDELSKANFQKIDRTKWTKHCSDLKQRYPVVLPEYKNQKKNVNSYFFIDVLSDLLTNSDIIVTDMGFAYQNTHQAFRVKKGQTFFTNGGLASMGWGLPAAIGASIGLNKNRTICIAGEGGLMMTIQELATIRYHNLPVKLFIFNNGGYLTIKQTQELGFDGRLVASNEDSGISFPEFKKIASAFGISYSKINNHKNLSKNVNEALKKPGPFICELMLDHDQMQAPKAINRRDENGNLRQTPLEDAYPFLDESEILQNMKIIEENGN